MLMLLLPGELELEDDGFVPRKHYQCAPLAGRRPVCSAHVQWAFAARCYA